MRLPLLPRATRPGHETGARVSAAPAHKVHVHRWLVRKYGVRVYEDGRRRTVVFLSCDVCAAQRSRAIARRELSPEELNAFVLKHYRQHTAFTGHGSDRPSGHEH